MAKYVYPAVFTPEETGGYSITFPDFVNCYTFGDSLEEGLVMASDVLSLTLVSLEDNNKTIPAPTEIKSILLNDDSFATLIRCDTVLYRNTLKNTAVKKTLSIPMWLNDAATAAGLNFSQVLQEALKNRLGMA